MAHTSINGKVRKTRAMSRTRSRPPHAAVSADAARSDPQVLLQLDLVEDADDWQQLAPVEAILASVAQALATHRALRSHLPAMATVALSSDAAVRELNRQWRNMDKPTNVLSFPAGAGPAGHGPRFLGDIVLAAETVAREAGELGKPVADHVQHLVVHGVLHLAGYDHEVADDAEVMEALEREILANLGVADPYADSDPITEVK